MSSMTLIAAACVLLIAQSAVCQDDDNSESCPPLKLSGLRITCSGPDGNQECAHADVGVKAKVSWKKTVLSSGGQGTDIVCKEGGVWAIVRSSSGGRSGSDGRSGSEGEYKTQTTQSGNSGMKLPGLPKVF